MFPWNLSGKGRTSSLITLNFLGVRDLFDLIVTGDDVENHKPSPDGIIKFIDEFKLSKNEVVMVGDAPSDIIAALSAGIEIASVIWDSYSADKVKIMNPQKCFYSVSELRGFLFYNSNY